MYKLYAFLKRDFLNAASYKFAFVSSFMGIFFTSTTLFFISKLMSGSQPEVLNPYGGDYFSFAIIGVAFFGLLGILQEGLPGVIRNAQTTGILESLLVTPTRISTILLGSSIYSLGFTTLQTVFQLAVAIILFGMKMGEINWVGVALIFFFTAVSYVSLGILSASFILVYKMGNPISWVFGGLAGLFGGVFFPIAVLPDWIRWISYALPITYSLEGMRRSLLTSAGLHEILPSILALAIFGGILLPVSLLVFKSAITKARRDGTLTHY